MFAYATILALLFGPVDDQDILTQVPTTPFQCVHARSFCFDKTGRTLICVTQLGELLSWKDSAEDPVVTVLEPGGGIYDRAPMSAILAAEGTEVAVYRNGPESQGSREQPSALGLRQTVAGWETRRLFVVRC
jgi:hypothetical protein